MATTTTKQPDPKPLTKRQLAAEAKRQKVLDDAQAKVDGGVVQVDPKDASEVGDALVAEAARQQAEFDASPSKLPLSDALIAEAFNEGATIAELAREVGKSHDTIRQVLGAHGVNFDHDKNALDLKDKVRQASAATIARRAANAADKAKLAERKKDEREQRNTGKANLAAAVLAAYGRTQSVKDTAEAMINEATGKPYSATRIRRILESEGVLVTTKRGDTSARDGEIVARLQGGESIPFIAAHFSLSDARVRSIGRKGGVDLPGGTRNGKLPEPGTPEYREFVEDVAKLTEKWGVALGTMAHAIRRAPDTLTVS